VDVAVLGKEVRRRLEDVRPPEKVHRLITLILPTSNLFSQYLKEV
jgi:hypothetical protein